MKTVEIKAYQYEELSPEDQAKVIDKYSDINVDYCWSEVTMWEQKDILKEYGFIGADISYSISHSQGDGACFDCKGISLKDYLRKTRQLTKYKKVLAAWNDGFFCIHTSTNNHRYFHNKTRFIDFDGNIPDKIEKEFNEILEDIEQTRNNLSIDIYNSLLREYEYRTTPEAIKETLIENEYYFAENDFRIV